MIDFELAPEVADLEAELLRFAERELRPRMREAEAAHAWDDDIVKMLDDFALARIDLPESLGGAGAGALAKAVALEAVAFGDAGGLLGYDRPGAATAAVIASGSAGAMDALLVVGERARIDFVPACERIWVSADDRLRLLDISSCDRRVADGAAFQASGGVTVDLAGAHAIGEWDVDGLALRGRARLWPASVLAGVARASLEYAIAYAKERIVMGKPVAHHQGNAFAIAETAGTLEAARGGGRAAALRFDAGDPHAGFWATLAFLDACDSALAVTDLGVQLLGGHGYIEDHPVEKWFREARALSLQFGGRDAALDDAIAGVLDVPDPVLG